MSGLWRRKLRPSCPACGAKAADAIHRNCPYRWPKHGFLSPLWIDITTGTVKCGGCKHTWPFGRTSHYCDCGAVMMGGEVWEGLAAEIGRIGNLSWAQAVGIKRGDEWVTKSLVNRFLSNRMMVLTVFDGAEREDGCRVRDQVKGILKAELKRRNVSYQQLAGRLAGIGVHDTPANIANKISRGSFTAVFMVQCLEAVGCRMLRLDAD